MKSKTRIGLAGIVGLGGATVIAVATGGAALPLLLLSATGFAMKEIASEPDYEPTYKVDCSISNIARNISESVPVNIANSALGLLNNEGRRRNYNMNLNQGAELVRQQLANLSEEDYENVKRINIFPESRRKILGLRVGRKSMEVGIEYE